MQGPRRATTVSAAAVAVVLLLGGTAGCSADDSEGSAGTGGADSADSAPGGPDSADEDTDTDGDGDTEVGGDGADGHAVITGHGIADHETYGAGSYVVEYTITNGGTDTASYFVSLEFLDGDGDLIGSTGVLADRLGPDKSTSGDAVPLEVELTAGTVEDIADVRIGQVRRTPAE